MAGARFLAVQTVLRTVSSRRYRTNANLQLNIQELRHEYASRET